MKKTSMRKHLMRVVVLLAVFVTIASRSCVSVYASSVESALSSSTDAGIEEDRTNIREPGTSEDADELSELNIANSMTVTYNDGNGTIAGALRIMLILTGIALAPILIICLTSFTRILIVMHFTRAALNTQTAPPNQILIALSLFLTFFIMNPVFTEINENAIQPFEAGEITQEEAIEIGMKPLREFMYEQTMTKDAKVFCDIGGYEWTGELEDIPTSVLIPSFMVSELRTAFIIGFVIYIPFIVIDMVVASTLMSMGMMMLPPTTISMPFKILLFVLADGWNLVIVNLVRTFY
jgi:flagellar biosynthetic protein FliP